MWKQDKRDHLATTNGPDDWDPCQWDVAVGGEEDGKRSSTRNWPARPIFYRPADVYCKSQPTTTSQSPAADANIDNGLERRRIKRKLWKKKRKIDINSLCSCHRAKIAILPRTPSFLEHIIQIGFVFTFTHFYLTGRFWRKSRWKSQIRKRSSFPLCELIDLRNSPYLVGNLVNSCCGLKISLILFVPTAKFALILMWTSCLEKTYFVKNLTWVLMNFGISKTWFVHCILPCNLHLIQRRSSWVLYTN